MCIRNLLKNKIDIVLFHRTLLVATLTFWWDLLIDKLCLANCVNMITYRYHINKRNHCIKVCVVISTEHKVPTQINPETLSTQTKAKSKGVVTPNTTSISNALGNYSCSMWAWMIDLSNVNFVIAWGFHNWNSLQHLSSTLVCRVSPTAYYIHFW